LIVKDGLSFILDSSVWRTLSFPVLKKQVFLGMRLFGMQFFWDANHNQ